MKPMHIDFASPSVSLRWWTGLFAGATLCASAAIMHWQISVDEAMLTQAQPIEAEAPVTELDDAHSQGLNEALRHQRFDWPQALSHLDAAMTPGTSLISADWQVSTREVKLAGEARSTADMLNFMDALKRDAWFQGLKLTRQEASKDGVGFAVEGHLPEVQP